MTNLDVALRFNSASGNSSIVPVGFELYQNEPNPFQNKTVIGFHLPEAAEATLSVFDETGRLLLERKGAFGKGFNTIPLDKTQLQATGVLYYRLDSASGSAVKKMLTGN